MANTWITRDLPVLQAAVAIYDETGRVMRPEALVARTGFDDDTVQTALRALRTEAPPFFDKIQGAANGPILLVGVPTGHARREAGAWPSRESIAEALAERLIERLNEAADTDTDNERSGALKATAKFLAEGSRDFVIGITTAALTG